MDHSQRQALPRDSDDFVIVQPCAEPLRGEIQAQPSKNYLSRMLWTAALCEGESRLAPVVASDDAQAMLACCVELGAVVLGGSLEEGWIILRGFGGRPRGGVTLDPNNAGAVLRFLLGATALVDDLHFITDRTDSLGTRPNRDLIDALAGWGVGFPGANEQGTLPLHSRLDSAAVRPEIVVSGDVSSQFLSSLLMVAPLVAKRREEPVVIEVSGDLKSKAAVRTTLDVMRSRGAASNFAPDLTRFEIEPGEYAAGEIMVNGDWPGAAAVMCAAAAVPRSDVALRGLDFADQQGERHIEMALQSMGCAMTPRPGGIRRISAPANLLRFDDFDGDLMTDAVPPLMAVMALAEGTSRVHNVENLRYKECNRIEDPLTELAKLGVVSRFGLDWFEIDGRPEGFEGGIVVDGHRDHRVIFLLTICGLRCRKSLTITSASHINKSYPGFFEHLKALGTQIDTSGMKAH